ncbi:hypothetical protein ACLKA6_019807 [Drosophila palustris]
MTVDYWPPKLKKPTPQIYYNKLIAATNIDATWNLVRFKARHLKTGWQKADAFSKSAGAGLDEGDVETTIRAKLLKMCPHYDQLDDIYSSSKEINVIVVESSQYQESNSTIEPSMTPIEEESLMDGMLATQMENSMDANDLDAAFVEKTKRKVQNNSLAQVAAIEESRKEFRDKRLVLETDSLKLNQEKFLWAKEMEQRKLDLEERKLNFEERKLNLEELRIQNDFKLKERELEMKMEMHKLELEYKYKK